MYKVLLLVILLIPAAGCRAHLSSEVSPKSSTAGDKPRFATVKEYPGPCGYKIVEQVGVGESYEYDEHGRITGIAHRGGPCGNSLYSIKQQHDNQGRLIEVTTFSLMGTQHILNTYDDELNKMIRVTSYWPSQKPEARIVEYTTEFVYDRAGKVVQKSTNYHVNENEVHQNFPTGDRGRLFEKESLIYEWEDPKKLELVVDENGRLKEKIAGESRYEYHYDSMGQLIKALLYGSEGEIGEVVELKYDEYGNLLEKQVEVTRWNHTETYEYDYSCWQDSVE